MLKFICYPKCTTCQKARKWLDENHVEYEFRDIKIDNPSLEELTAWHKLSGLPLKKFFNTSGLLYKSMDLKNKLPAMTDDEMLALLATDGMLVKRPLLVGDRFVLTGFKEADWDALRQKHTSLRTYIVPQLHGDIKMLTDKEITNKIETELCSIWENQIKDDFDSIRILNEDALKTAIYFHLRTRLGKLFDEQDIRILTEFTDGEFAGSGYRPDMVVAKINMNSTANSWRGAITECLAIIELKHKSRYMDNIAILDDYDKLKYYIKELGVKCKLYMATIWECEDDASAWIRKNAAWAKSRVIELNASYKRNTDYESQFYVVKH